MGTIKKMLFRSGSAPIGWSISDISLNSSQILSSTFKPIIDPAATSLHVTSGGTRFYTINHTAKTIKQGSFSIAHDINSTITLVGTSYIFASSFTGIQLNSSGTKVYTFTNGLIKEYNLSSAWDITTVSVLENSSLSYPSATFSRPFSFNRDGTKLYGTYVTSSTITNSVFWTLSTAWDISSVSSPTTSNIETEAPSSPTDCSYIEESGDEMFIVWASGTGTAFRNGITNSDFDSTDSLGVTSMLDGTHNDYLYGLARSGSTNNYTWTIEQYLTNV
jgi:hypothetical protein